MVGKIIEMVSCVMVFVVLVSVHARPDDGEYVKQKRSYQGVSGLTPFPRTGRSDPDLFNWDSVNQNRLNTNEAYGSFEEYEEYPHIEVKRQGLIPFPRVGRSGPSKYLTKSEMQGIKRGVPGSGNAMWFGPRLGRIQKRNSGLARNPISAAAMQDNNVGAPQINDYDLVPIGYATNDDDTLNYPPSFYPDSDIDTNHQ